MRCFVVCVGNSIETQGGLAFCGAARRLFCEVIFDHPPLHSRKLSEVGCFIEDDGVHAEEFCAAVDAVFQHGETAPGHGVFLLFDVDVERVAEGLAAVAAGEEDAAVVFPLVVQHVVEDVGLERTEVLVVRPHTDLPDEVLAIEQDMGDGQCAREVSVVFVVGECPGLERELCHAMSSCAAKFSSGRYHSRFLRLKGQQRVDLEKNR